jgi:hypothetical protein
LAGDTKPLRVCSLEQVEGPKQPNSKAFSLLPWVGNGGYVQPFFDGPAAPRPVSPITPKVKML